jgi:hypothetical protein
MFRVFRNSGNHELQLRRGGSNTPKSRNLNKFPANGVLRLQRSLGNQIFQRLIQSGNIMAKLMIESQGDPSEQEADQVADRVMQMPEPEVQRRAQPEEEADVVQSRKQNIHQRSPVSKIEIVKKPETGPIDIEKIGPNVSRVLFMGEPIATVRFYGKGDQKIDIHFKRVSGDPGKTARLQVILDCLPDQRIHLHRSAIENIAKQGVSIQVGVRPVGIEVTGGVETKQPILPPRTPEVISVDAPEEVLERAIPGEPKMPEVTPPEEEAVPLPPGKPKEPEREPGADKMKTEMERKQIRNLLKRAERRMLVGNEYESLLKEAADIAAGILKRKTAAFDPRTATEEATKELIRAVEDVMLLPEGDEAAIERAMEKTLRWAEGELKRAVKKLTEAPTEDSCRNVADKAAKVMLLGGDPDKEVELMMTVYETKVLNTAPAKIK